MKGDVVGRIQKRLYELGYYDQDITEYYGPFTRDAIKAFQKALGVLPTGIADEATQKALFADDAPVYSEDNSLMNDAAYQMDEPEEQETKEETKQEDEIPVIADSVGISSLSMNANPYSFTRTYGESGPLQTMGVFSYKSPTVVFYRNGESYEVTEEMMETPCRRISQFSPKRSVAYRIQFNTSRRSSQPKPMNLPSLLPWARSSTIMTL